MTETDSSLDNSKEAVRCIKSLLETEISSESRKDLDAIHILAEDTGSCIFKVDKWTDPISLSGTDEKILLLRTFLLMLWQQGRLTQLPCDPLDVRVARPKKSLTDVDDKLDRKELEKASATETSAHVVVEASPTQVTTATDAEDPNEEKDSSTQPRGLVVAVDSPATAEAIEKNLSEEDDEIQTVEDLPLELMGPLEIDLQRKDDYHSLFSYIRKSYDYRKKFFLESKHIVNARKLSGIDVYYYGYKFNRTVLQMTAPSLQELDVSKLRNMKELKLLEDIPFPKLRRLNIQVSSIEHENNPFEFAPPGEGHCGLRWLRCRLPRPALQSLLRPNAKSLLELYVEVGTPSGFERDQWPTRCEDLHSMLGECGFSSLRRLVLLRGEGCWHTRASCYDQVRDVRKALPGVLVECESCRPD